MGKFIESTVYGPDGSKLVGAGVEEKEITDAIENSYFFGQFMAYWFVLRLIEEIGIDGTIRFAQQKIKQIVQGNPSFWTKAEELEKSLMSYYRDSMENKDTHVKEK